MAALAIFQNYLGAMVGNADVTGNHARVEFHRILDALQALRHQVVSQVIIGQVAVDAFDTVVGARVKPGLIFRLEHMATAAKLRTLGFGIEARRSKSRQYPQDRRDRRRNQHIDQGFSLGKAILTCG